MNGATYDPRPNTRPRTPPAGVQTRREHVRSTVHRVLERRGFMVRVAKKPAPFKWFQRRHVDFFWQLDVYEFPMFCEAHGIRLIFGRPYNRRGRAKLERLYGILTQELVDRVHFRFLAHIRQELYSWGGVPH